jgi:hypothetical protein
LKSLGDDYTEAAIRERLAGRRIVKVGSDSGDYTRVSLLVDIQAKIREGRGAGYEQWAKVFNLKAAAKTLIWLQEQGIDSYDGLKKKTSAASGGFAALTKKIRDAETRMNEVSELKNTSGSTARPAPCTRLIKSRGGVKNITASTPSTSFSTAPQRTTSASSD